MCDYLHSVRVPCSQVNVPRWRITRCAESLLPSIYVCAVAKNKLMAGTICFACHRLRSECWVAEENRDV